MHARAADVPVLSRSLGRRGGLRQVIDDAEECRGERRALRGQLRQQRRIQPHAVLQRVDLCGDRGSAAARVLRVHRDPAASRVHSGDDRGQDVYGDRLVADAPVADQLGPAGALRLSCRRAPGVRRGWRGEPSRRRTARPERSTARRARPAARRCRGRTRPAGRRQGPASGSSSRPPRRAHAGRRAAAPRPAAGPASRRPDECARRPGRESASPRRRVPPRQTGSMVHRSPSA